MPKVYLTEKERREQREKERRIKINELVAGRMKVLDIGFPQLSEALRCHVNTVHNRLKNPGEFRFREFWAFAEALQLSQEEIALFVKEA